MTFNKLSYLKLRLLIILIVLIFFIVMSINYKFYKHRVDKIFYDGNYKVWAHRGYHKNLQTNSIESFSEAFDRGARGVELDVFYDKDLKDFIVSHDYPYELHNDKLLTLEHVFSLLGNRGYFWVDFKQLDAVQDIDIVVDKIANLLRRFNLTDRVIIESPYGLRLRKFSEKGLHTSYWINPSSSRLTFVIQDYGYRALIAFSNFSAISMNYKKYNKYMKRNYSHLPIHLFTVNDRAELDRLVNICTVKVVLSDEDYYSLKQQSCSQN